MLETEELLGLIEKLTAYLAGGSFNSLIKSMQESGTYDRFMEIIQPEGIENITPLIMRLNRVGELDEFLRLINYKTNLNSGKNQSSKILIIGRSEIKPDDIQQIVRELHLDPNQIEIIREFDKLKSTDFAFLKNNSKYKLVLVGPMPHSTKTKDKYNSAIVRLQSERGFPRTMPLIINGNYKITKTNIKQAIGSAIESGLIQSGM